MPASSWRWRSSRCRFSAAPRRPHGASCSPSPLAARSSCRSSRRRRPRGTSTPRSRSRRSGEEPSRIHRSMGRRSSRPLSSLRLPPRQARRGARSTRGRSPLRSGQSGPSSSSRASSVGSSAPPRWCVARGPRPPGRSRWIARRARWASARRCARPASSMRPRYQVSFRRSSSCRRRRRPGATRGAIPFSSTSSRTSASATALRRSSPASRSPCTGSTRWRGSANVACARSASSPPTTR